MADADIFENFDKPDENTPTIEMRELSNDELADISNDWENATVDTSKYYQNVFRAWETNQEGYELHKYDGGLCQQFEGRFIIA